MKRCCIKFAKAVLFLMACRAITSYAGEEEGKVDYVVSFVDAEDYNSPIFNRQQGSVWEGGEVRVSFPEQLIGSDGHIWKSAVSSPQTFTVHQAGVHKYYIEYHQGEKITKPEEEDKGEAKLEEWLSRAWKADCLITGQDPQGNRPRSLLVENEGQNDERIRNLVSMIQDSEWHCFYLIGKAYIPQTTAIGTSFDAAYSSVREDSFFAGRERYTIVKILVCRRWKPEQCTHEWEPLSTAANSCLEQGSEICRCKKCRTEETVLLPALGHLDENGDSLCDRCGKRAFMQKEGDKIVTTLQTERGEKELTFLCLDSDYNGTGQMLYLAEAALDADITGECFEEAEYNYSPVRTYLNLSFANNSSLASALLPIVRPENGGQKDSACLLSKEEYERYAEKIGKGEAYFLRSMKENTVYAVDSEGSLKLVPASGNTEYGVRPFVLLEKPDTEEQAEPFRWREGDIQMRQIGSKRYRFRCVDEDYSDAYGSHRKAALFLCDRVIRADIDSSGDGSGQGIVKLSFGKDNNYKSSDIREWLIRNSKNSSFLLEPVLTGVSRAYTGSTEAGSREQLDDSRLIPHDIGFQLMQDRLFCLSVEEAFKYREALWSFSSGTDNPETQLSPYSQGYYLRTPFYEVNQEGRFCYGSDVYAVDLETGNIRPVPVGSETYGIRPAFALPQQDVKTENVTFGNRQDEEKK